MLAPRRLLALFIAERQMLVAQAARLVGDASLAEDVVQDAWLRLSSGSHHAVTEPVSYLRRIVRNLALDEYRRRVRHDRLIPVRTDDDAAHIASAAPGPEHVMMAAQELSLVTAELARMPVRMRRAVELHRVAGATLREIADELGISITTAHKLVGDGVERCRRCLGRGSN